MEQIQKFCNIIRKRSSTGSAGLNILDGGSGNDTIQGGMGNDTLIGGAGLDTVTYAASTAAVTVNLSTIIGQNTVGAGTDTISGFENLTGSAFNDTLTGDANANVIEGLAGNDVMNGAAGTDTLSYRNATAGVTANLATTTAQNTVGAGSDTISNFENLIGSSFNDTLTGNGSANVIEGGLGNDLINGAAGTDTVKYANVTAGVTVNLTLMTAQNTIGAGTDTITNIENLTGSVFSDILTGNTGVNVIDGDEGDDMIQGGAGNDTLVGGNGVDTLTYASSAAAVMVNLSLTAAQNTVGAGSDMISGFENLTGTNLNDTLTGDANVNTIRGGAGNDTLNGGDGNDLLYGSSGFDTLTGGANADTFVFETASAFSNVDTITDFSTAQGDKIDLHDILDVAFDPLTSAISDFVNFTNSGANSVMSIDRDGTGTTYGFVNVATLNGVLNLDEATLYTNGNLLLS